MMSVVMEEINRFTPLGIRFWDPVFDCQIRDALHVTIHPVMNNQKISRAYRTIGDIYTFNHIYGLWDIETSPYQNEDETDSPLETKQYIVNIHDDSNRYLDVSLQISLPLPYRGVFLSNHHSGSPSTTSPKGLYLYSSTVRRAPGWVAMVRGEMIDVDSEQPVSGALLKITAEGGETHYGISDKQGRFMVLFAYPVLVEGFGGSPSSSSHRPLSQLFWELELEVFYSPELQQRLPGSIAPDYISLLTQQAAEIWEQEPGEGVSPVSALSLQLSLHKTIIARTEGLSNLLISTQDTSP